MKFFTTPNNMVYYRPRILTIETDFGFRPATVSTQQFCMRTVRPSHNPFLN